MKKGALSVWLTMRGQSWLRPGTTVRGVSHPSSPVPSLSSFICLRDSECLQINSIHPSPPSHGFLFSATCPHWFRCCSEEVGGPADCSVDQRRGAPRWVPKTGGSMRSDQRGRRRHHVGHGLSVPPNVHLLIQSSPVILESVEG